MPSAFVVPGTACQSAPPNLQPATIQPKLSNALKARDFTYLGEAGTSGHYNVVIAARSGGDGHSQVAFFFDDGNPVGTDVPLAGAHFGVNLCEIDDRGWTLSYLTHILPSGPIPGCPTPTVVAIRWTVADSHLTRHGTVPTTHGRCA